MRTCKVVMGLMFVMGTSISAHAGPPVCTPFWQPGFAPVGASGTINTMGVFEVPPGSKPALYAGGIFSSFNGVPANRIAKFDGASWQALSTGLAGASPTVFAMAVYEDELYVGGSFNSAGVPVSNIARWNGTTWSAVGAGFNNAVRALHVHDDGTGPALYAGGSYTVPSPVGNTNRIMRWNGTTWTEVGTWMNNVTHTLKSYNGHLYAGGAFGIVGGASIEKIARWNGVSWSAVGSGTSDISAISTLQVFDDGDGPALYAGGTFSRIGGVFANQIAKWNGTTWAALGSGLNGNVASLAVFDEGSGTGPALYAAGTFTASARCRCAE